jgi:hypothetical protein
MSYQPYPPYDPSQPQPPTSAVPISSYPQSPYPQSPYPPPMQQQVVVVQSPPSSGTAVASMVLGILGLVSSCCSFGLFSLGAIILGHAALVDIKKTGKGGHGMAVAGLVMGYVFFIPAILFSIWMVLGAGMTAISPSTTP